MTMRKILFRAGAVGLLLLIAALMLVIGRGHTVYLDSKSIEYNGKTYASPYKTEVFVENEQVAKLYDNERGMTICIGPNFTMSLAVTQSKGGGEEITSITVRLPQKMDGVAINLPALLAELPEEAYLSEFVVAPTESELEEEEIATDEFGLPEEGMEVSQVPA